MLQQQRYSYDELLFSLAICLYKQYTILYIVSDHKLGLIKPFGYIPAQSQSDQPIKSIKKKKKKNHERKILPKDGGKHSTAVYILYLLPGVAKV